jgi:streptogramin lyase
VAGEQSAARAGVLWLVDEPRTTVLRASLSTGEPVGQPLNLPSPVSAYASGFGSLWLAGGGVVHRIDPDTGSVIVIRMPEGAVARGIAVHEPSGSVWVSSCVVGSAREHQPPQGPRPGCEG